MQQWEYMSGTFMEKADGKSVVWAWLDSTGNAFEQDQSVEAPWAAVLFLNKVGAQGWELFDRTGAFSDTKDPDYGLNLFLFKRPKP